MTDRLVENQELKFREKALVRLIMKANLRKKRRLMNTTLFEDADYLLNRQKMN